MESERELKICAAENLLLVKILFEEVRFKASFEGREGRAEAESEMKRILDSCNREAEDRVIKQTKPVFILFSAFSSAFSAAPNHVGSDRLTVVLEDLIYVVVSQLHLFDALIWLRQLKDTGIWSSLHCQ